MSLTFKDIQPLVEKELAEDPKIPRDVMQRAFEAVQKAIVVSSAKRASGPDVVLEDPSGRVLLVEIKAGTGKSAHVAERVVSELLKGGAQAAILTGPTASAVASAMTEWRQQLGSYREVLEALAPKDRGSLSAAAVLQARRNAEARRRFLEEFPALTSGEVADLAHSRASNRASLANRWRDEDKVFAVRVGDQQLYPAFQFNDQGRPLEAIAAVLKHLSKGSLSDWQTALWFTSANGWLGGERPVDVLSEQPVALAEAASHEVEEIVA
jgi:hypothetical protein